MMFILSRDSCKSLSFVRIADGSFVLSGVQRSRVLTMKSILLDHSCSFMGTKGEITVDQAHRGACVSTDSAGYASMNPLFMKYAPTNGMFSGQSCYGVKSFENFIDACRSVNAKTTKPSDYDDGSLATVHTTMQGTAILEAGRMSLDADGQPMDIQYENDTSTEPSGIKPHEFS